MSKQEAPHPQPDVEIDYEWCEKNLKPIATEKEFFIACGFYLTTGTLDENNRASD
jgi:hypothetical protein